MTRYGGQFGWRVRRRDFLALVGSAAVAAPTFVHAQRRAPVVGFLSTRSPEEAQAHTGAFLAGLREAGFVDGQNIAIEYRWARGDYARLPALAAELTGLRVAIMAAGGDPSAVAAKAAAGTIPIVFIMGDDPVRLGLVANLNRPGGNATGVSLITSALGAKRLEILCEMMPRADAVGLIVNPTNPNSGDHAHEVAVAAQTLGRRLLVLNANTEAEIDSAFASLAGSEVRALVVGNDPFFDIHRDRLVALAAHYRIAAAYHIREFPASGGLMSYGPSLVDGYREFGVQAGRLLKAGNASDIPVVRPTRFELVINLATAKTLGLTLPESLLTRADEVIE